MRVHASSTSTRMRHHWSPWVLIFSALLAGACGLPAPAMPVATVQAVMLELTPTPRPVTPTPTSAPTATTRGPLQTVTVPPNATTTVATATVRPAATPVASPPTGRREVSFNGWYTGENPGFYRASLDTATGAYHLVVLKTDYNVSVYVADGVAYGNVTLEVDASRVAGPDAGGYGLVFLRQPKGANEATSKRYVFYVTPQGMYRLYWIAPDGSETNVVSLTGSPAINVGDAVNRLSVTYAGGNITVGVNGTTLQTVPSTIVSPGEAGVYASSATESKAFEAAFQNFVVTVP